MDKLFELEFIDVGGNAIKAFPEKLPNLPKLNRIVLKDNQIAKLPELIKLG